jgi:hypothetical protein
MARGGGGGIVLEDQIVEHDVVDEGRQEAEEDSLGHHALDPDTVAGLAAIRPVLARHVPLDRRQVQEVQRGQRQDRVRIRRMRDRVRAEEVRAGKLREAEGRGRRFIRRIAAIVAVGVPDARHRDRRDRIARRHLEDARVERLESRDEDLVRRGRHELLEVVTEDVRVIARVSGLSQVGDQVHELADDAKHVRIGLLATRVARAGGSVEKGRPCVLPRSAPRDALVGKLRPPHRRFEARKERDVEPRAVPRQPRRMKVPGGPRQPTQQLAAVELILRNTS